jgi:hypothetical protein
MPKRLTRYGESTTNQRMKEGQGQDRGIKYKPWLRHDLPSKGHAWRTKGWKTERSHHLLNDFEHEHQVNTKMR